MTDNTGAGEHDEHSILKELYGWQTLQEQGRSLEMYSAIYKHQVAINEVLSHTVECLVKENQAFGQEIQEMKANN